MMLKIGKIGKAELRLKEAIEKIVPANVDERDDIVQLLMDQALYPDIYGFVGKTVKPSFVINDNPLLTAIQAVVGQDDAQGVYEHINSWRSWAPKEVLKGILQQKFDSATADSAIYGKAGRISPSDYGDDSGPVQGGWNSDEVS